MTAPDRRPPIHRGPAANRLGTDAPDALDRWLEFAVAGSGRRNAALTGQLTGQRNSLLNGHARHGSGHDSGAGPDASESLRDMSPLVAAAREFHAYIGDAERQHGPAVPETEIWERIMNDRLSLPGTSPALPMPVVPRQVRSAPAMPTPYVTSNVAPRKRSAFMNVLTGAHPVVSLLLAAAVAVAILAVFRSFAETGIAPVAPTVVATDGGQSGSGSEIHLPASGSGPAASFLAAATPASPGSPGLPAASDSCGFAALEFGDGTRPLADYTPTGTIPGSAVLDQVEVALTAAVSCSNGDVTLHDFVDLTDPNLHTPEDVVTLIRERWPVDSKRFVDSTLDSDIRNHLRSDGATTWMVDPATLVVLPDSRIGGFAYVRDNVSTPGELGLPLFARVVIFAPSATSAPYDLVLDEIFLPCTATVECDAGLIDEAPESTPVGSSNSATTPRLIQAPAVSSPASSSEAATPPVAVSPTPVASPEAGTPRAALPTDGTLLLDTGSSIVSRPLDGSPGTTLESDDPLDPPMYTRTGVPGVVIGAYGKTAINTRTGQMLAMDSYENAIVSGPFWVQYTSQTPAVPVDARIVDLWTMETAGFFDLAGVDPAGLGPQWLIEGTASGTLGVGVVDHATESGPPITPTMLLIDGDLERTRAVPLWLPGEVDFDGDVLAFSPDGSLVAYLTGTTGNVAIQVETISGELIQRIPWPGEQPIDRLILTDAGTMVIMAEGRVSTVDVRQRANPLPIAAYPNEIRDTALSPDGSHLLFATFDPLSDPNVTANTAWHMLDIGTGEVRPIPQATGGTRIAVGPSVEAGNVMLWVPVGPLANGTYRVLFVDVTTGAVTAAQPTGVTSGSESGEPISGDGIVFAAYGSGSPETAPYRIEGGFSSLELNGSISVFDAASQSDVTIPMPEIPATAIEPSLIVSPDGEYLVLSVRWTDASGEHTQSWLTTTDGASGWTPIDGGLVIQWLDT